MRIADGKVVRREDLNTTLGRSVSMLRKAGIISPANHTRKAADRPELTEAVRFSLMLDGPEPAS